MEVKSPEVSIRFAFCSSVSLCGKNREQIFRLPKSSRTMVYDGCLLIPNSSSRRSCASIFHTSSIIFRVLLVDGRPERGSSSVVSFPPVHLHQHFTRFRWSFPQFVAELDVCMLLHCAMTLLLTLTTFNWPQSLFTAGYMQSMLCVDSPHVSEEPCSCAHTCAKLAFRYDIVHRIF